MRNLKDCYILSEETVKLCKENNILLEAYIPLSTGRIFEVKEIQAMAQKYNKTIDQVSLRWSLEKGYLPLPKSVTASRIKENTDILISS
ncbi:hypothetical protein [Clostridium sp.]|uniref:hypothetical protein n=1 Tax=Clostridium sp. TaxID=1506 RepID=UPI0026372316|nr:hypothetical protein [Clostridium sp.]